MDPQNQSEHVLNDNISFHEIDGFFALIPFDKFQKPGTN